MQASDDKFQSSNSSEFFASMSVDELWEIHEEISKLLEAKMLAEKKMLERRLDSLHPAKTDRLNAHRPYRRSFLSSQIRMIQARFGPDAESSRNGLQKSSHPA
jgi:hypothetical protein